jgi:hypothetical protein
VFAGIGSASGVLTKPLEAAIIIMVIATTFLAPPFLRIAFKGSEAAAIATEAAPEPADVVS